MNLLFKYPTRARPDLFRATLAKYVGLLSGKHPAHFVISCDADDPTMNNAVMRDVLASLPDVEVFFNDPPQTKITAVNANMEGRVFDLLVLCSDDMIPQVKRYDDRIVELFCSAFPDGDGVLHLNDGKNGLNLNTLCICDRKYYERFNYIYNPEYVSLWADNEWQEVSEALGRAAYFDEVLIRHEWIGNTDPGDALHLRNERHYGDDRRTFERRKAKGFP